MKTVQLHGKTAVGLVALVDDEDYPLISRFRWNVKEYVRRDGSKLLYAHTRNADPQRRWRRMHQLILSAPIVDHEDNDGLNNQRSNLRPATMSQNLANRVPAGGASRFRGVRRTRNRHRWGAQIMVNYKNRYLGTFDLEEDAARAYDAAALQEWGEYAYLNFPDEDARA